MLACIACSKQVNGSLESSFDEEASTPRSPSSRETIKSLTHQLKGIAVKFSSGAYRHCRPCATAGEGGMMGHDGTGTPGHIIDSMDILDVSSELSVGSSTHNSLTGSNLSSLYSTPAQSFKGTPSRSRRDTSINQMAFKRQHSDSNSSSKRGINFSSNSVGKGSNGNASNKGSKKQEPENRKQGQEAGNQGQDGGKQAQQSCIDDGSAKLNREQNGLKSDCEEENVDSEKEWVAQVEPGVLITFVTLLDGGNDLKRIRFSREMFNKWQAQQWWAENCDKVHELYNVPKFSRMPKSLPTPSRSEDEGYKSQSSGECKKPKSYDHGTKQPEAGPGKRMRRKQGHMRGGSMGSEVVGTTDVSSACVSEWEAASEEETVHHPRLDQCCRGTEEGGGGGGGNGGGKEEEWVQEDVPGVYITLVSSNGSTELKRIRFSREKFTEMQARIWWEENRVRVYEHYL